MTDVIREAFEALTELRAIAEDTDDHPAHIEQLCIAVDAGLSANAVTALQSAQGEPVAWAVFSDNGNVRIWGREKPKGFPEALPVFISPTVKKYLTVHPAPVAVPEPYEMPPFSSIDRSSADYKSGWNACRKAMLTAAPSPDHSPDAGKVVYQCPRCSTSMEVDLAAKPTPTADGGEVGPVGWIWETYGQRNFTAGTHHKNVLEADGVELTPVYTHPAPPRNELDSEDQKGMERIVEAVAHIGVDFGYGTYELKQCHIDRAREIKESLDRLRSNGGDV